MDVIGLQLVNAWQLGSAYALLVVGYTMVYGVLRLINFAQADIIMLGTYRGVLRVCGASGVDINAPMDAAHLALGRLVGYAAQYARVRVVFLVAGQKCQGVKQGAWCQPFILDRS
jgi:branched-chain amino acid transport system permease protein